MEYSKPHELAGQVLFTVHTPPVNVVYYDDNHLPVHTCIILLAHKTLELTVRRDVTTHKLSSMKRDDLLRDWNGLAIMLAVNQCQQLVRGKRDTQKICQH